MLFSANIGRMVVQKEKSGSPQELALLRACPGENTTYTTTSRTARIIILSFSPLCKRNSSSCPHRLSRHRVRASVEKDREKHVAVSALAGPVPHGRKDLPNPDGLHPSWMPPQPVVGGEPPGTCQRDGRGTPPDPLRVFHAERNPYSVV